MAPDINAVTNLIKENKIWGIVKPYIDRYMELSTHYDNIKSPTSFSIHDEEEHPSMKKKKFF